MESVGSKIYGDHGAPSRRAVSVACHCLAPPFRFGRPDDRIREGKVSSPGFAAARKFAGHSRRCVRGRLRNAGAALSVLRSVRCRKMVIAQRCARWSRGAGGVDCAWC